METILSLKGMYDIHVHAAPSIARRKFTALEALKLASNEGMRGFLLLDHTYNTEVIARVLNEMGYETKVFGSILLNESVGGLNPSVVETAIRLGTKQIQMPTYSAQNHKEKFGDEQKTFPYQSKSKGICILDNCGRLISEVEEILQIIKDSESFLGTGHLSIMEIEALVCRAKELKIRVLVNGISNDKIGLPITVQKELAGHNVFMEHDFSALKTVSSKKTPIESIVEQIHAVGADRCVIATDSGQLWVPNLIEGLKDFIRELSNSGVTQNEVDLITKETPRILLGI